LLAGTLGRPVEVLNFGCSGFSSVTEHAILINFVGRFAPDVVVCFHHFSDMTEDWLLPPASSWRDESASTWRSIAKRSQLCRLVLGFADRHRRHRAAPPEASLQTSFDAIVHDPYTAEDEEAWGRSLASVGRMAQWCADRGLRFLVAVIPIGPQIESVPAEFADQMGFRYLADGKRLENANYQRCVCAYCREHDIACLDLLPAFRTANARGQPLFYLPRDQHWNAAGHALAAKCLASYILLNGKVEIAQRGNRTGSHR
jgi:hypothetical protein